MLEFCRAILNLRIDRFAKFSSANMSFAANLPNFPIAKVSLHMIHTLSDICSDYSPDMVLPDISWLQEMRVVCLTTSLSACTVATTREYE